MTSYIQHRGSLKYLLYDSVFAQSIITIDSGNWIKKQLLKNLMYRLLFEMDVRSFAVKAAIWLEFVFLKGIRNVTCEHLTRFRKFFAVTFFFSLRYKQVRASGSLRPRRFIKINWLGRPHTGNSNQNIRLLKIITYIISAVLLAHALNAFFKSTQNPRRGFMSLSRYLKIKVRINFKFRT